MIYYLAAGALGAMLLIAALYIFADKTAAMRKTLREEAAERRRRNR